MRRCLFLILIAAVLTVSSCVSTSYRVDYTKSSIVSFDADLPKGYIWDCIIEGENRKYAELIAADYVNLGEGADIIGKYVFYINPLKKGTVEIKYVNRDMLADKVLEEVMIKYNIVEKFGRLVLEEA